MRRLLLGWGVVAIGLLSSCNGFKFPKWQAEILGPLANTELAPEDVIEVQEMTFSYTFRAEDIRVGGVPIVQPGLAAPIPAFGPIDVGYFDTVPTPQFRAVVMKRMRLSLRVRNGFPFPVSAGTTILLRNQGAPTTIVEFTIPSDLAPGAAFSQVVDVLDRTITENLQFQLQDLRSPGTGGVPVSAQGTELQVGFTFSEYEVERLEVNPGQFFQVVDTSAFTLEGDVINSVGLQGDIIFSYRSGFPVTLGTQAYFLDDDQQTVLDSLFLTPLLIPPATVDANGTVLQPSVARDTIPYSAERIQLIQAAKYVRVRASASTQGSSSFITVTPQQALSIKFIGDLQVDVNSALDGGD